MCKSNPTMKHCTNVYRRANKSTSTDNDSSRSTNVRNRCICSQRIKLEFRNIKKFRSRLTLVFLSSTKSSKSKVESATDPNDIRGGCAGIFSSGGGGEEI